MKWFVGSLVNFCIAFTLAVAPVGSEAFAQDSGFISSADEANAQAGSEVAVSQSGEKYSKNYIELLVMLTLGLIAVLSPLPTRTERSKNDCMANFSGPVSVMLIKIMGVVYILNEIRANIKYNKNAEHIKGFTKGDFSDSTNTGSGEQKVVNYDEMYQKYIDLYESQQKVLDDKIKYYKLMQKSLYFALGMESIVAASCTAMCMGRHKTFEATGKVISTSAHAFEKALVANIGTFINSLNIIGTGASQTELYSNEYLRAFEKFYIDLQTDHLKNRSLAEKETAYYKQLQFKEWVLEILPSWSYALLGNVKTDVLNSLSTEKEKLEDASSITQNESRSVEFENKLKTTVQMMASAGARFEAAMQFELSSASTYCTTNSTDANCAPLMPAAVGAYSNIMVSLYTTGAQATSISSMTRAADKVIEFAEKNLGDRLGKMVESGEDLVKSKGQEITSFANEAQESVLEVASVAVSPAASSTRETALSEVRKQLENRKMPMDIDETIAHLNKVMQGFEDERTSFEEAASKIDASNWVKLQSEHLKLMSRKHTCCGSNGRKTKYPSMLMPIPRSPGSVALRVDLYPDEELVASNGGGDQPISTDTSGGGGIETFKYEGELDPQKATKITPETGSVNHKDLFEEVIHKYVINNSLENFMQEEGRNHEILNRHSANMFAHQYNAILDGRNSLNRPVSREEINESRKVLNMLANVVGISSAQAGITDAYSGFDGVLGISGVALAVAYRKPLKKIFAYATRRPINRIAFYSLLAYFNDRLIQRAKENKGTAKKRINVLRTQQRLVQTQGAAGTAVSTEALSIDPVRDDFAPSSESEGSQQCLSVSANGARLAACPVQNNPNNFSPPSSGDIARLGPGFASTFRTFATSAASLASNPSNESGVFNQTNLDRLDSDLDAIRKKGEKAQEFLNESLKDSKGKPILKTLVGESLRKISSAVGGNKLASAGPSSSLNFDQATKPEQRKTKDLQKRPDFKGLGTADLSGLSDAANSFDLDNYGSSEVGSDNLAFNKNEKAVIVDDLKEDLGDINEDSGLSLFEMLSARYKRNYVKILRKKEN